MEITTNNIPRDIIYGYELTDDERREFDYYKWDKIEKGEECDPEFFRYKGEIYDLDEFMRVNEGIQEVFAGWDGYISQAFYFGLLVKFVWVHGTCDQVVVGRYCT